MLPVSTKTPVRFTPAEYDLATARAALDKAEEALRGTAQEHEDYPKRRSESDAARARVAEVEAALAALDGAPPVYLIAVPSLRQRLAWRRDLAASGARYAPEPELIASLRRGVEATVIEEDRPALLDLLDRFEAAPEEERDAELVDEAEQIGTAMRTAFGPYAALLADRQHWIEMAPLLAAERFLTGWENVEARFNRAGERVAETSLRAIPEGHLAQIGWKAIALMRAPQGDVAKN
jgi:hypothetical protein